MAALDIGKASLVACVRVPHEKVAGRRRQEVGTFATTISALPGLRDWLVCQGVTRLRRALPPAWLNTDFRFSPARPGDFGREPVRG